MPFPVLNGHPQTPMAYVFQHHQDISSTAYFKGHCDTHTVCRQERHSSYYLLSHDPPHSANQENGKNFGGGKTGTCFCTPEKVALDNFSSYSPNSTESSCPCREVSFSSASCSDDLGRQRKVVFHPYYMFPNGILSLFYSLCLFSYKVLGKKKQENRGVNSNRKSEASFLISFCA